jgi:hypothetical protein
MITGYEEGYDYDVSPTPRQDLFPPDQLSSPETRSPILLHLLVFLSHAIVYAPVTVAIAPSINSDSG